MNSVVRASTVLCSRAMKSKQCSLIDCLSFVVTDYRNDLKFSDKQVWAANSADKEQTAPRGAVWSGSSLFAIPFASF